ncbi:sensor histidine kinase [Lachnoclostridium sp.]|nr:sensor histidine kinase [Lachnoclostridium sp.]
MKLTLFLKDKLIFILGQICIVIFVSVILSMVHISTAAVLLICGLIILIAIVSLLQDYSKRSNYYRGIYNTLHNMNKKQYIASLLENPTFADAEILCDILRQATKAMNDEIADYQIQRDEYREYIETWIHEVKLPISCIILLCENNRSDSSRSILEEMDKIEGYVDQALFYARSTNVEKDYTIRSASLDVLVKAAVKKHSKQLIACKTSIQISDMDYTVYTDTKWLDFILEQVISNSIKYKKNDLTLSFKAKEENANIVLCISDNGIGIPTQDLGRVFEKGFTGVNGRRFAKSTGIGLYLCKQLSEKMGLGFDLKSKERLGTSVFIIFPKDKLTMIAE